MLGVAIVVFLFMRLTPGDPVDIMMGGGGAVTAGELEQLRHEFHLDEPLPVQLWLFFKDAVRGDLGYSYVQKRGVITLILERLPATIELATGALLFALLVAMPIGIISAVRQNSPIDRLSMAGAFLGISMPSFWLGIILILVFAVYLQWLPVQGRIDFLPSITLGAAVAAVVARVLRSSMLETLRSDYVMLARAKGAPERGVVLKHALRNALIPTVTVVGLQVGVLLGGNMIVETVFSWPGLGRLTVTAIFQRDFPLYTVYVFESEDYDVIVRNTKHAIRTTQYENAGVGKLVVVSYVVLHSGGKVSLGCKSPG
jgi:peptide/nickel transport system permease protein